MRHGDFVGSAIELQAETGLFVLGERHHASGAARVHTSHHLERVIRGVAASVLVATTQAFVAPQQVVVAFDGSAAAHKALAGLARHPLLVGLPVHLLMVAPDTPAAHEQLQQALAGLQRSAVKATAERVDGEPHQALPARVKALSPALLVMGAFGHSRLRQCLLGSTTSTLLRVSDVPVLILR